MHSSSIVADRFHKVLQWHHTPSSQDLGGPFGFCPCIPAEVPDGPGGGMFGPIIPKEINKHKFSQDKRRI